MRQLNSLAILLLLSLVAPFAAMADSFKVAPADLELGTTATLQFVLENTQPYYGFQAQVTLPEGLKAVADDKGNLDITLSDRTADGKYAVGSNILANGNLIMSTFSGNHSPITGESGVLVDLKVNVTTDFTGGDVEVSEIYFIDKDNKDVVLDDSSTALGVKATSLTLSDESVELKANGTATLTATLKSGETPITKTLKWESDKTDVATVSKGVVTAKAVGEATITVSYGDLSATCKVTVSATPVEGLSVLDADENPLTDGAKIAIHTGDNYNFTAVVTPADATDKTVEWTTNDPSVIEFLDNEGLIHALKAGDATVTAKIADFSFTANVNVTDVTIPVTGVTLDQTTAAINTGKTLQLKATIEPADASSKTVTWSSSDRAIATVSTTGLVTAVKAGKVTITATASGKTATCEITISDIEVTAVTLNQTEATLTVGDNLVLEATVAPEDATVNTVTWTSSDEAVATVDEDGHVTAVKSGTATITATSGTVSATCAVTVKAKTVAVTGITLNKTTLSLTEGDSSTLTATIAPANATDKSVTWTSSDAAVATVENGVITAVAPGTATITATSANGKTAVCTVTVNKKVIAVTGITLDKRTATLTEGETLTLTATVAPDDATDKTVTWTSSNVAVATVENGVVTAVAPGTATISAKAGEKTAVCTVTVNAKVIEVSGITLDKTEATLTEGESLTLTATVTPDDATDKTVAWTSSNEAIATVDADGKVTAVAAGEAVITAKAGEKTASCTVTVKATEKPDEPIEPIEGTVIDQTFNADTKLADTDTYTWGAEIQGMIKDNGLYLTNASNKANNYENRDFLTFAAPVGSATSEVEISYEVYSPRDKGQNNTYYDINYFNAEGDFVFGIQEASGGWAYTANIVTANADGTTTTAALPAGHMSKGGGSTVNATVRFAGESAIIAIDGGSYTAFTKSEGIKAVKLSVTGENGYDRDMYVKNYSVKTNKVEAVEFAEYTLKYVADGETIKETVKSGVVGEEISLAANETENFYNDDKTVKYLYVGNDAEGKTVEADGSTIVTIDYRVAAEYSYTVKNNVNDAVKTGTCIEGESVTVAYSRYIIAADNTVWQKYPGKNTPYTFTFTPDADNYVAVLEYTATDITDGIFFVEGEDIEGMTEVTGSNANARCSNAAGGYADEAVAVYTLKPGTYKVAMGVWGNTGATFTVKAGEETILTAETAGYWFDATSEEFTVEAETTLTFEGATSGKPLDYILITGTVNEGPDEPGIVEVEEITLDVTEATLIEGKTLTIIATVTPDDATDATVTWSSSDESVATVDQNGTVTAVSYGVAVITAKAGEKTAECTVKVDKATGVEAIGFDSEAPIKVYDLNGAYVSDTMEGLQKGCYIVRQGDAAKKVFIR